MKKVTMFMVTALLAACSVDSEDYELEERAPPPCAGNTCADDPSLGYWNGWTCANCELEPDPETCVWGRYPSGRCKPGDPCDLEWSDGEDYCPAGYVGDPAECFDGGAPDNCAPWPAPEPIIGCCRYGGGPWCPICDGNCAPKQPESETEDFCKGCTDLAGGFCISCNRGVQYPDGTFDCWGAVQS